MGGTPPPPQRLREIDYMLARMLGHPRGNPVGGGQSFSGGWTLSARQAPRGRRSLTKGPVALVIACCGTSSPPRDTRSCLTSSARTSKCGRTTSLMRAGGVDQLFVAALALEGDQQPAHLVVWHS